MYTAYSRQPAPGYMQQHHQTGLSPGDPVYAVPGSAQASPAANSQPYIAVVGQPAVSGSQVPATAADQGVASNAGPPKGVTDKSKRLL